LVGEDSADSAFNVFSIIIPNFSYILRQFSSLNRFC